MEATRWPSIFCPMPYGTKSSRFCRRTASIPRVDTLGETTGIVCAASFLCCAQGRRGTNYRPNLAVAAVSPAGAGFGIGLDQGCGHACTDVCWNISTRSARSISPRQLSTPARCVRFLGDAYRPQPYRSCEKRGQTAHHHRSGRPAGSHQNNARQSSRRQANAAHAPIDPGHSGPRGPTADQARCAVRRSGLRLQARYRSRRRLGRHCQARATRIGTRKRSGQGSLRSGANIRLVRQLASVADVLREKQRSLSGLQSTGRLLDLSPTISKGKCTVVKQSLTSTKMAHTRHPFDFAVRFH